jgi:hypothetical protein
MPIRGDSAAKFPPAAGATRVLPNERSDSPKFAASKQHTPIRAVVVAVANVLQRGDMMAAARP